MVALAAIAFIAVLVWLLSPEPTSKTIANVGPMLVVAACYLGLAALLTIVLTAMNLGKSKGGSKLGLIVFGALVVVALICYFAFASASPVTGADGTVYSNPFTLKISDTMLYLAYIALGGTVLFLLWGEIRKALK